MNDDREHITQTILGMLGRIAPEADLTALAPDVALREQLDIDSFDFLNLVMGLHEALGVAIPEADYARLATLESAIAYLAAARQDPHKPTGTELRTRWS
jgi:acyl carrier protein